jgi:hypothetical protein
MNDSDIFLLKPIELARPKSNKYNEKKKKSIDSPPSNRISEITQKLHLTTSMEDHQSTTLASGLSDESLSAEKEQEEASPPLLPPSLEEMTFNDDDKTLNDLLSSLHSTKVRRMHKYTDEQLNFMHKHNEFNRMLQSYVDVSIYNGKVCFNFSNFFYHSELFAI